MIINYNKIAFILLLTFPVSILLGSFLVNLSSTIIAIIFLIYLSVNKATNIPQDHSFLLVSLFFCICLISSLFSSYKLHSLLKSFSFIRELLFFIAIYFFILKKNSNRIFNLSKVVFFISIFICADLWIQSYFGKDILGYPVQQAGRLTSVFGDEQIPGSVIFKFLPFAMYYLLSIKKKFFLVDFRYLIFMFMYFSILITGERAASLLATLFLFLLVVLNYKIINKKFFLIYALTFLLGIGILYQSKNNIVKERILFTVNKQIHNNVYEDLFLNGLKGFYKNPFIGSGVQTYRYECPKSNESCSTHPHHYILEMLSDIGMIGFFSYATLLFYLIYQKLKKIKKNSFVKTLVLSFAICLFFPLIPTGSIFSSFSFSITLFSLGFVMALENKKFIF